jgi:hypothetical protein
LITAFTFIYQLGTSRETFGTFKDWDYSGTEVFGFLKLVNPVARHYYRITKQDSTSVRVEEINASEIIIRTVIIKFVNGQLSKVTHTNQWGDTYKILIFVPLGNDEFTVTETVNGKNSLLPCKTSKFIYKNNLLTEVRYTSFDGRLANGANGVAIIRYKRFDDDDRFSLIKEQAFYDEQDSPVINKGWDCHKVVYERDERGNELSRAHYDEQQQPVANRLGAFKFLKTYDLYDNELENSSLGLKGEVTPIVYGVAKSRIAYKNGLKTKTTFYDADNNIVKAADAGSGLAITKYEYDERGNQIKVFYFDENERPMNDHQGIQRTDVTYSNLNMVIEVEFFDKEGRPVADKDYIHRYAYTRDKKGRIIQSAFFDNYNTPVENRYDRSYIIKIKYDSLGHVISNSYWRENNVKMHRWDGYHEKISAFNEQGQEIISSLYNEKGKLFISDAGYSSTVTKYNQNGQIGEYQRFIDNTPVTTKTGDVKNYHSVRFSYDEKNRISQIEYFDTLGNPTNAYINVDDGVPCHKIEMIYTGNNVVKENLFPLGSRYPFRTIDCLTNAFVSSSGTSVTPKKR